jgi:predicted RNA binding protein YcfA (HicA-like mRNA interferase family)
LRRLPAVSGEKLLKMLGRLGYILVRQRGSHVRLKKATETGDHNITIPRHDEISKGTLNDILSNVSMRNNISREELIDFLEKL